LIGLFVGPVILAVMMAVWREWLEESTARKAAGAMPAHATPRDGSGT
ncbi:MAG: AI-2E family transporter, partial [Betaproteobacteria bacterium]|nr:AI-2E family transporter [Betaproteobacteria bacterium]